MNIVGILWQLNFISVLLAYGIDMGLFARLTKLSKNKFIVLCAMYTISILFSIMSLSGYVEILSEYINNNVMTYYLVIAIFLIIMGILTLKISNKKHYSTLVVILTYFTLFVSSIATIIINVVIISTSIEITLDQLGIFSIILLLITMFISYLTSNYSHKSQKDLNEFLSNYMILFGEYVAVSAIIMPKMTYGLENTTGITINSAEYILPLLILMIALFIVGIFLNKRDKFLK